MNMQTTHAAEHFEYIHFNVYYKVTSAIFSYKLLLYLCIAGES